MDVPSIWAEDRAPLQKAPPHGEEGVHDGKTERQDRYQDGDRGRSFCDPAPRIDIVARTNPRNMLPESPMKMVAGLKLYRSRNPMIEPANVAETKQMSQLPPR